MIYVIVISESLFSYELIIFSLQITITHVRVIVKIVSKILYPQKLHMYPKEVI